jgi:energy-coupling factor transport system permease protein
MSLWQNITLGQFIPGRSFIHRLDPRAKLICSVFVFSGLLTVYNWPALLGWIIFLSLAAWRTDLRINILLRNIRGFLWLFAVTLALHSFTAAAEGPQVTLPWGIYISWQGVVDGLLYTARLVLMILAAAILTLTTPPNDFADSLERLLAPLNRLRVPVHELAFVMTLALRFVPAIAQEAVRIQRAQVSRGAPERGSLLQQVRQLVPMIVPLFIATFHRADELALAMEARGYRGHAARTRFREFRFSSRDVMVILICAACAWTSWYFGTPANHANL